VVRVVDMAYTLGYSPVPPKDHRIVLLREASWYCFHHQYVKEHSQGESTKLVIIFIYHTTYEKRITVSLSRSSDWLYPHSWDWSPYCFIFHNLPQFLFDRY
jgi:hypothetical protein